MLIVNCQEYSQGETTIRLPQLERVRSLFGIEVRQRTFAESVKVRPSIYNVQFIVSGPIKLLVAQPSRV